jgi:hypothetical protein
MYQVQYTCMYVCMYKVAPESVLFLSISVREISKSPLQRILLGPSPLPHKSPGPSISLKVFSSRPSLKSPKVCRSRMEGLNWIGIEFMDRIEAGFELVILSKEGGWGEIWRWHGHGGCGRAVVSRVITGPKNPPETGGKRSVDPTTCHKLFFSLREGRKVSLRSSDWWPFGEITSYRE